MTGFPHKTSGTFLVLLFSAVGLAASGSGAPQATHEPGGLDLVGLFPYAEVRNEVSFIDIGEPTAREHLLEGWLLDQRIEEVRRELEPGTVAGSFGETSVLRFWLAEVRDFEVEMECWGKRHGSTSVEIRCNGHRVGAIEVVAGDPTPRQYRVVLPARTLRVGDNQLAFVYPMAAPLKGRPTRSRHMRVF